MNIADSNTLHDCTSCQMCAAVCPTGAISIALDSNGFYRPTVDATKCVDCSLCTSVCYKYDRNVLESDSLDNETIYGAKALDSELVEATTSGGIADVLARSLIKQGYKCIGVCYDTVRAVAYHAVALTENETVGFRGSKYIQSYTFEAFKQLVANCKKERFAIFGLPCQVYAIHRYLEKRRCRDRHILIDLYCHGTPSMHIWRKYNNEMRLATRQPHFDAVNFRSKVKGWGNFYVVAVVDGEKVFVSDKDKDEFYTLFFSDVALNGACYDCKLRSTLRYTDIRLGDFWGKAYVDDHKGVSAVSIATDKGQALFGAIKDEITYNEHSYKDFLPYQSYGKVYRRNDKLRDIVFSQLRDEKTELKEVIRTIYQNQTMKQRVRRHVKNIVSLLPSGLISFIKKLYYKSRK